MLKNDNKIIAAQIRENFGTRESRKLRRSGFVPAKLSNPKTGEITFLSLDLKNVAAMTRQKNFLGKKIKISIDGDFLHCAITDFELHPLTLKPIHVELTLLVSGASAVFKIPVEFNGYIGSIPYKNGERLNILHRFIKIFMPIDSYFEKINIDVSVSKSGQKFRASDLNIPTECKLYKLKPNALLAGFIGRRSGSKSDQDADKVDTKEVSA